MPVQDTIDFKDGSVHHVIIFDDGRTIFHREDGPAVEWASGTICWFFEGKQFTFEDWLEATPVSSEEKVMLKLKYG